MHFSESIITAGTALNANRLRSFLTMLGIIIGVGSVITMVAIGEGSRQSINERLKGLGTDLLIIRPGAQSQGRASLGTGSSFTLTMDDASAIQKYSNEVAGLSPEFSRNAQVKYSNKNVNTSIVGCLMTYMKVRNFQLAQGRFFEEEEVKSRSMVAVIGKSIFKELFANQAALDKVIKISGMNFQVIGILESKGQSGNQDQDDQILVPLSTAQIRIFGVTHLNTLAVQVSESGKMEDAMFDIERALRRTHRLRSDQANDFNIRNQADILATAQDASQTMSLLLASIATISLIVGGIGIMNIMVVSVTERTKEIGIRKAIGAKKKDILLQFLIEALLICMMGGVIGIGVGVGSALLLQRYGWNVAISANSVLLSFGLSALVGLFFGFYPALKAASSNVIESLRYE